MQEQNNAHHSKNIVILGGGITGLAAAERLSETGGESVILIEKEGFTGGLAATLEKNGLSFDFGSHRIHKNSLKRAQSYLRNAIGEDLLERPRNGKLYFRDKYVRYPPHIFNLMQSFTLREMADFFRTCVRNVVQPSELQENNYETCMIKMIGKRMYDALYRDYAWKVWGRDPREISIEGINRRKESLNARSLIRSFSSRKHKFMYPKHGIGQIARTMEAAALKHGVRIIKGATIRSIELDKDKKKAVSITFEDGQGASTVEVSRLLSTIPIDELHGLLFPGAQAAPLQWRGARFLCLHVEEVVAGESETYYFPDTSIIFGRVSRISKYSPYLNTSAKGTFITIEIPSSPGEQVWDMPEAELLGRCLNDLVKAALLKKRPAVLGFFSVNMPKIYPAYVLDWQSNFSSLFASINRLENVLTLGHAGLFLHCNIDHCIVQGLDAAELILNSAGPVNEAWRAQSTVYREFNARD